MNSQRTAQKPVQKIPSTAPQKTITTEAEAQSVDGKAGKSAKSSKDAKSHTKASSNEGAGGGKKQQRHH